MTEWTSAINPSFTASRWCSFDPFHCSPPFIFTLLLMLTLSHGLLIIPIIHSNFIGSWPLLYHPSIHSFTHSLHSQQLPVQLSLSYCGLWWYGVLWYCPFIGRCGLRGGCCELYGCEPLLQKTNLKSKNN